MYQSDLFEPLLAAYRGVQIEEHGVTNAELYRSLNLEAGQRSPVGRSQQRHNLAHRKVRWHQQSMKALGLIERVPGQRGTWRLTPRARKEGDLTRAPEGVAMIACSTTLGVAIWTRSETLASQLTDQISAIITSPPYPLRTPRAYGGVGEDEYVDFICNALEPLLKNLVPGGTVALNLSNDIFLSKSPARSLYIELLTIALQRRLGLFLHDRVVWSCPNKVPGPTYWASITRQHLTAGHEPVLIFCNDPVRCIADNRRVLQPHTEQHMKLIARGGERRTATYGDGAYKLRPGSFGAQTAGRILRNVLTVSHSSGEVREARKMAKELGLALHGALMPEARPAAGRVPGSTGGTGRRPVRRVAHNSPGVRRGRPPLDGVRADGGVRRRRCIAASSGAWVPRVVRPRWLGARHCARPMSSRSLQRTVSVLFPALQSPRGDD